MWCVENHLKHDVDESRGMVDKDAAFGEQFIELCLACQGHQAVSSAVVDDVTTRDAVSWDDTVGLENAGAAVE